MLIYFLFFNIKCSMFPTLPLILFEEIRTNFFHSSFYFAKLPFFFPVNKAFTINVVHSVSLFDIYYGIRFKNCVLK